MQNTFEKIRKAVFVALWFMFLTFPILAIKYNSSTKALSFEWERSIMLGIGVFFGSMAWDWYFKRKALGDSFKSQEQISRKADFSAKLHDIFGNTKVIYTCIAFAMALFIILPLVTSIYQTTIFSLALIYVILALGLNIVVGIAGQLVLGYAAFYAVGAYTYALLNQYFGFNFWLCLPLAALFSTLTGLLLGFPVLRLRGDYLAIVTLGFGEITRLLFTNLSTVTNGARGISNIPRPGFMGIDFTLEQSTIYIYYLALIMTTITIIIVSRLKNSRVGLALQALREDEIACEAMGVDLRKIKLSAFALSSCWAGFAGVLLAARNTYINPASFTFMDSAMILAMVVLGGMGSIWGVVLAAMLVTLVPEYLRAFSEYRMLLFGALMVLMMVFRPQGMIPPAKRKYKVASSASEANKNPSVELNAEVK